MDVAASEFCVPESHKYDLDFKTPNNGGKQTVTGEELTKLYEQFAAEFPITSIEDPFDQDDWAHYAGLTAKLGKKVQIVGDDLLVTNVTRIKTGL
jgi:enolase